jgi:hypothetical protein
MSFLLVRFHQAGPYRLLSSAPDRHPGPWPGQGQITAEHADPAEKSSDFKIDSAAHSQFSAVMKETIPQFNLTVYRNPQLATSNWQPLQ